MKRDSKYPLLAKSTASEGIYQEITREEAEWEFLNFNARLLKQGEVWEGSTGDHEFAIILLSGNYSVTSNRGDWKTTNGRKDVFSGIAHTSMPPDKSTV